MPPDLASAYEKALRALEGSEAAVEAETAKILAGMRRRMAAAIERALRDKTITRARANDLMLTLRRVLDETTARELSRLAPALIESVEGGLLSAAEFSEALYKSGAFSLPEYREIVRALSVFEGPDAVAGLVQVQLDAIASDIRTHFVSMTDSISGKISQGLASGYSSSKIAASILTEAGQINVTDFGAGALNDEAFARALARTSVNQISNEIAVASGLESGMDHFANMGIPDERQSPECEAASNLGALTLAEWDATDVGPAPRHPNCRCRLLPVPADEIQSDDLLQGRADRPESQKAPRAAYMDILIDARAKLAEARR